MLSLYELNVSLERGMNHSATGSQTHITFTYYVFSVRMLNCLNENGLGERLWYSGRHNPVKVNKRLFCDYITFSVNKETF